MELAPSVNWLPTPRTHIIQQVLIVQHMINLITTIVTFICREQSYLVHEPISQLSYTSDSNIPDFRGQSMSSSFLQGYCSHSGSFRLTGMFRQTATKLLSTQWLIPTNWHIPSDSNKDKQ